jgi:glycosyltransferase involved in cell wall biosynthesis
MTSEAPAVIALLIPCYNEELTIAQVIKEFRLEVPEARIYVFDNNSSDRTAEVAKEAGAIVIHEGRQGKGFVVQTMFRHADADVYVMVDGDGTYPAKDVEKLLRPIIEDQADMVVGSRLHFESDSQFRTVNRLGNKILLFLVNSIFKVRLTDILSGYRSFSRKFVKGIPLNSKGFEIETELTIKALERGYRVTEVSVNLTNRPEGSHSKIRVIQDGLLIFNTIFALFRDYKPLTFFGALGLVMVGAGLVPGLILFIRFIQARALLSMPLAVLAVGLVLSGMLSVMTGLILHTIVRRFQELEYQRQVSADDNR